MKIQFIIQKSYYSYLIHFKDSYKKKNELSNRVLSFCSAYIADLLKDRAEVIDKNGGTKFFNRIGKWV